MKAIIVLTLTVFLAACGGGGGGGGSSPSASSAFNFTASGTLIGVSSDVYDYGSYVTSDAAPMCAPSTESCQPGVEIVVNSATNGFTFYADQSSGADNYSSGYAFAASDIASVTTLSDNYTLSATSYAYSSNDVANEYTRKVTIIVPSNYSYQYYLYWDNTHMTGQSSNKYKIGLVSPDYSTFASLPSSGTATYTGGAEMIYATDNYIYSGGGTASFSVNWAAKTISGTLNTMSLSATGSNITFPVITMPSTSITESAYSYDGSNGLAVFSGSPTFTGVGSSSQQEMYGHFLGSAYNEIGGTFAITSSGGNDGGGYFSAKR